ncbi:LOW QUALITY PROTEIN: hypothetical protein Cgig2_016539 [Carnegiea gigantea]|uniref:Endonuclease/exonuclease/phosphatase domain-containing protein n=1 Tax=Carnegiea gigantea TaxID=171969 RepID=A0A9Q1JYT2_9CARY|nr:LOW QUALITY PROTEIN: hypothetical protein Cgig2_016539 [Carnegiea gigantea]
MQILILPPEELWDKLETWASRINHPWLLAGDFNKTRSLDERDHDGLDMARHCSIFNSWIENNGSIDIRFSRPKFIFQEGSVKHLVRNQSDHAPILISTVGFSARVGEAKLFDSKLLRCFTTTLIILLDNVGRLMSYTIVREFTEHLRNWNKEDPSLEYSRSRGRDFPNTLTEQVSMQRPQIVMLLETHISGSRANNIYNNFGFRGQFRVDASGLVNVLEIYILEAHEQFVTGEIRDHGGPDMAKCCSKFNNWIANNASTHIGSLGQSTLGLGVSLQETCKGNGDSDFKGMMLNIWFEINLIMRQSSYLLLDSLQEWRNKAFSKTNAPLNVALWDLVEHLSNCNEETKNAILAIAMGLWIAFGGGGNSSCAYNRSIKNGSRSLETWYEIALGGLCQVTSRRRIELDYSVLSLSPAGGP